MDIRSARVLSAAIGVLAFTTPSWAGGFAVDGQSAVADAMGGAVSAFSSSPSALFHNPGGAAFLAKKTAAAGVLYRATQDLSFEPQTQAGGVATSFGQADATPFLPHAYYIQPLMAKLNLGTAVTSAFDLDTRHENPDSFPGRATSVSSEIQALDLSFHLAGRFGETVGVGVGVVARTSEVSLLRRVQTGDPLSPDRSNPDLLDYASLDLESDLEIGLGWSLGLLHRASSRFSWGLSYRSEIRIDYTGTGKLTQIPTGNDQLDESLAASNPFDQDLPMGTFVAFPEVARLGLGLQPSGKIRAGIDVEWTGWSRLDQMVFDLPGAEAFSSVIQLGLDDSLTYRLGLELTTETDTQWRLGFVFDESPQAPENLNAFLLDSDRKIVSAGIGKDWLQVAVRWVTYENRTGGSGDFAGTFGGDVWHVSLTLKSKLDKLGDKLPEAPEVTKLP